MKNIKGSLKGVKTTSPALIIFTSVTAIADVVGALLIPVQIAGLATGAVPIVLAASAIIRFFSETFANTLVLLGLAIYIVDFIVSLIVLIIYFSIVLASKKGTFSVADNLIAISVFITESIPFLGGFLPSWSFFATYLRFRQHSKTFFGK